MSNIFVDSLQRRIRAMNVLWDRAAHDMTLEQVNHHERSGILPIAFSISHAIRVQDRVIQQHFFRAPPLWETNDWARRIAVTVDRVGPGVSVAEMELLRFGDLAAWIAYQSEVIATTDRVLDTLDEAVLQEVVGPPFTAESIGFTAIMVGVGNPLRKLDVLEGIVYQHGLRHLGEMEHARALVGLGGLAG